MEKKSLIGASAAKQKSHRKSPESPASDVAELATPAESRRLAVAKLATAKLSTARLVTLKKLGG